MGAKRGKYITQAQLSVSNVNKKFLYIKVPVYGVNPYLQLCDLKLDHIDLYTKP